MAEMTLRRLGKWLKRLVSNKNVGKKTRWRTGETKRPGFFKRTASQLVYNMKLVRVYSTLDLHYGFYGVGYLEVNRNPMISFYLVCLQ